MYDPTIAPQYIGGGGYGGWGGGCGIGGLGGGAFAGGFLGSILGERFDGRRDGRGGGVGNGVEIILDDNHYNSLTNNIGQVKAEIGAKADTFGIKFNAFELAQCAANAATNANIANGTYQGALNTKDIIHDLDTKICLTNRNIDQTKFEISKQLSDCCCAQKELTILSTQRILDRLCENRETELRDRVNRLERDNDLFRMANVVATNVKATTVGSNFNTGTQSASNNSGQING